MCGHWICRPCWSPSCPHLWWDAPGVCAPISPQAWPPLRPPLPSPCQGRHIERVPGWGRLSGGRGDFRAIGSGFWGSTVERKSERWEGGVVDPKSQDAFLEVPPTSIIEGSNCNPYKALALQGRHSSGHFSCTSSPNPLGSLGGWGGTVIPVLWRRKLTFREIKWQAKITELSNWWKTKSEKLCLWWEGEGYNNLRKTSEFYQTVSAKAISYSLLYFQ